MQSSGMSVMPVRAEQGEGGWQLGGGWFSWCKRLLRFDYVHTKSTPKVTVPSNPIERATCGENIHYRGWSSRKWYSARLHVYGRAMDCGITEEVLAYFSYARLQNCRTGPEPSCSDRRAGIATSLSTRVGHWCAHHNSDHILVYSAVLPFFFVHVLLSQSKAAPRKLTGPQPGSNSSFSGARPFVCRPCRVVRRCRCRR